MSQQWNDYTFIAQVTVTVTATDAQDAEDALYGKLGRLGIPDNDIEILERETN